MESKKYSGKGVEIIWTPSKCVHSGICLVGLPKVFRRNERPWINLEGAEAEKVIEQVRKCPSGALSLSETDLLAGESFEVTVSASGPYIIQGPVRIKTESGEVKDFENGCALCRCGASSNKPLCDGSHRKIGFS